MRPSRIHLPACLRSTPITASPRYYAGSDSCHPHHGWQVSWVPLHGLRDVLPPTTRRRLLTLASPFPSWLATTPGRIGFVFPGQARDRVCGPSLRLRLLPTPPHGDAVTFSYGPGCWPGGDSDPTIHAVLPAPWRTRPARAQCSAI